MSVFDAIRPNQAKNSSTNTVNFERAKDGCAFDGITRRTKARCGGWRSLKITMGWNCLARTSTGGLAGLLQGVKRRFILSLNDHAFVRRCFEGFEMEAVETAYTVTGGRRAKPVRESYRLRRQRPVKWGFARR